MSKMSNLFLELVENYQSKHPELSCEEASEIVTEKLNTILEYQTVSKERGEACEVTKEELCIH